MEHANFAASILQHVTNRTRVMPITDVHWSAWNTAQSIKDSLLRLGMPCPVPLAQYIDRPQVRTTSTYFEDLSRFGESTRYRGKAA